MKFVPNTLIRAMSVALVAGAFGTAAPTTAQAQDDEFEGLAIEEIVVRARKRDENLQTVPVAVTAITSNMIKEMNVLAMDDIAKLTSGLVFDAEFSRNDNRPVIRGQANILNDSGVSFYVDGVYITGSILDYDLNDIERIEVVKGPQSALYGRNTYSGAINIITKTPGDSWSTRGQVQFTDDSQQEISASVKGPLGDSFGIGLTGRYYKTDGFWTNTYDNTDVGKQESSSLSAVAVFEPSDRFTARARVYYAEQRDGQPALWATDWQDNNCFQDNGSFYGGGYRYFCGVLEPLPVNSDWSRQAPDAREDVDIMQASLSLDISLTDNVTLTSITGYNQVDTETVTDGDYDDFSFSASNFTPNGFPFAQPDFSPIDFANPPWAYGWAPSDTVDFTFANADDINDVSQELRLTFEGERSEFMIGAYYFDQQDDTWDIRELPSGAQALADANWAAEQARLNTICGFNPTCAFIIPLGSQELAVPRDRNSLDIRNTAIFGLASFDIGDATRLTFEGRYAEEKIDQVAIVQDLGSPADPPVMASKTFTSFSPRVTIDHRMSDDSMVYALFAKGNKPGGFNGTVAIEAGLPTFDEEEVESFEIGSKNMLADGQVMANFAVYFNKVTGYQLTQNARSGTNTTSATVNAGDAEIFGLEIDVNYRPRAWEGFKLAFNYAFTDPEFTRGTDQNWGVLLDADDDGLVNCSTGDEFPNVPGCTSLFGDITGKLIPRVAEHQGFLDAELRRPFGSGNWEYFLGANVSYESSKFAQVTNFAETGSATLVNARVGFTNDRYFVSLWGKNLTGEDSSLLALRYASGEGSFRRNFAGTSRRDTFWGVTASVNFE